MLPTAALTLILTAAGADPATGPATRPATGPTTSPVTVPTTMPTTSPATRPTTAPAAMWVEAPTDRSAAAPAEAAAWRAVSEADRLVARRRGDRAARDRLGRAVLDEPLGDGLTVGRLLASAGRARRDLPLLLRGASTATVRYHAHRPVLAVEVSLSRRLLTASLRSWARRWAPARKALLRRLERRAVAAPDSSLTAVGLGRPPTERPPTSRPATRPAGATTVPATAPATRPAR